MPTTVLQAAVGAGKTEAAIQRLMDCLAQTRTSDPFPKAWVLLATKRQEIAFRQRLIEKQSDRKLYFNVEFFNFYELNTRILNIIHVPIRRIHEPARLGLVRTIAEQLYESDQLQTFRSIWHTQGFVSMVANFIYELKQNLIESDIFAKQAITQKDRELAMIYSRYQDILREKKLVDREGEGWLAEIVTRYPHPEFEKVKLLLVDGYDQFNLVQAQVLANLAKHIENVTVTLTVVPQREQTIGRRFEKALQILQQTHAKENVSLYVDRAEADKHRDDQRAEALKILTQNIFLEKPRYTLATQTLHLLEAPEPAQEVSAVLRQIKRMILDGTSPDDILIAIRDWERYGASLNEYRRMYQIPMLLHFNLPIAENPALVSLINVLLLSDGVPDNNRPQKGFRRRDVLDVLRSAYIQVPNLTVEDVELLEKASLRAQVIQGRDEWLEAIQLGAKTWHDYERGRTEEALYDEITANHLHQVLSVFFDHITPVGEAFVRDYVLALEKLIGREPLQEEADVDAGLDEDSPLLQQENYTLGMIEAIRALDNDDADAVVRRLIARDVNALNSLKRMMRGFLHIEELMQSTLNEQPEPIKWDDFFAELRLTLENATETSRNPIRNGRVLATTASEARGLPHAHVFILGLSEGIFPKPISEDPLYLDTEREHFRDRGILLDTQAERANDDGIFYELISLPYQTLTLSRPTIREGKLWNESHLWRMTKAVFEEASLRENSQIIKIGELVNPSDVASVDEAILAVAESFNQSNADLAVQELKQWMNAHTETRDLWQHIAWGRHIENRRMGRESADAYSGVITEPQLRAGVAQQLGDDHYWSASQFNELGRCGYYFFAHRLLKLQELEEPSEGLDARKYGSIIHAILERTYEPNTLVHPDNLTNVLDRFKTVFDEVTETAPKIFFFKPTPLWQIEKKNIQRQIESLVRLDFSDKSPFNKIKSGGERRVWQTEYDFSGGRAFRVPIDAIGDLLLGGKIDRIDVIDQQLIIVDYKTGTTPIKTEEMSQGRNFQMMVYILALQHLLNPQEWQVAGGFFWHTKTGNSSGDFTFAKDDNEALQDAQHHLSQYIEHSRAGIFPIDAKKPAKPSQCTDYCPYYQVCRLGVTAPKGFPNVHTE